VITAQFEVEFRKDGAVHDDAQVAALLGGLGGATDLLVMSHGWNNDMKEARALYDGIVASMQAVLARTPALAARRIVVARVFWPSKKFAETELIPGGGAASATAESDAALRATLEALKVDPDRLGGTEQDPARQANVDRAIALIDELDRSAGARNEFVLRLRAILNPDEMSNDDGSREFFEREPEELFQQFGDPVPVQLTAGEGGVASVSDGGAAFLGDLVEGIKAAARRIANFTTYYQMKTRAGTVGTRGVATVLARVRDRFPELSIHLVGHSFGGRLVTAAASALPPGSRKVTLALLQAAFSHNALAKEFDGRNDGAFRTVLKDRRVSGPVIITHTKNDTAVGIAYPLASRVADDVASALGDENDPYGGLGRNGALHTPEVAAAERDLRDVTHAYAFKPGSVYNLHGSKFIADHGAVRGPQVAHAILQAIALS
jgi:hypothetical protein